MAELKIIDDISSNLSVRIKRSYCSRHSSDWIEKRTKLDYTLWNIMQGNVYIECDNITYTASVGDVIFFYPGTSYTAMTDSDGCQFLYSRFSVEMGSGIDVLWSMNLAGIIPSEHIGKQSMQFCKQFMELSSTSQNVTFNQYSVFISYLSEIINVCRTHPHVTFNINEFKASKGDPNILAAMEYIEDNFNSAITIRTLAKKAAMSEKYFISCFKKVAGIAPGQYVIQCRMRRAAELLLNTNMKISAIASSVGYANPYTFSNTFKKYYEESPANFKNHFVKKL